MSFKIILSITLLACVVGFLSYDRNHKPMINGVCLVAPHHKVGAEIFQPIKNINANWVAIVPYAYIRPSENIVKYNFNKQFWGETEEGVIQNIVDAQKMGLKVMLKPHIWVINQGWAGDYEPSNEIEWKKWEQSYTDYILTFSAIADSLNVPLFCIGTEFRKTVTKRPEYWKNLIKNVRKYYKGKVTYAANWDNYENVTFWDELDFIGIDAYFPLLESKTPDIAELVGAWQPLKTKLNEFSKAHSKPILFTEFGYESKDYAADGHWKHKNEALNCNMTAQSNAYSALFSSFWNEPWFSGGFLWKWFPDHEQTGGITNKQYTPQNKPAEATIKAHYSRSSHRE